VISPLSLRNPRQRRSLRNKTGSKVREEYKFMKIEGLGAGAGEAAKKAI
jgi:hypothetical protein